MCIYIYIARNLSTRWDLAWWLFCEISSTPPKTTRVHLTITTVQPKESIPTPHPRKVSGVGEEFDEALLQRQCSVQRFGPLGHVGFVARNPGEGEMVWGFGRFCMSLEQVNWMYWGSIYFLFSSFWILARDQSVGYLGKSCGESMLWTLTKIFVE